MTPRDDLLLDLTHRDPEPDRHDHSLEHMAAMLQRDRLFWSPRGAPWELPAHANIERAMRSRVSARRARGRVPAAPPRAPRS